jgi:hypothetical protein
MKKVKNKTKLQRVRLAEQATINCELRIYRQDRNWEVRNAVAKNPNTPLDVLEKLSKDTAWGVRCNTAAHPNVSLRILSKLLEDAKYQVRTMAFKKLLYGK